MASINDFSNVLVKTMDKRTIFPIFLLIINHETRGHRNKSVSLKRRLDYFRFIEIALLQSLRLRPPMLKGPRGRTMDTLFVPKSSLWGLV